MLADDPYVLLTHSLLSRLSTAQLHRALTDDDYIRKMVMWEVRHQDFAGEFVDCIVQNILETKHRSDLYKRLDTLSDYFFSTLDLARLRDNILKYGTFYNLL